MVGICTRSKVSGRNAIVMAQQSTEETLAADGTDLRRWSGRQLLRRPRCRSGDCQIPEPLVRAVFVVETNVRLADVVQMAQAETHEVVQALSF